MGFFDGRLVNGESLGMTWWDWRKGHWKGESCKGVRYEALWHRVVSESRGVQVTCLGTLGIEWSVHNFCSA